MNGCGSGCVWLSTVTCASFIASSSADCVFGVVRLISSASTMLAKIGPGLNSKFLRRRIENADADHVARQQVRSELDALKRAVERTRQRLRQRRLAHAGNVFNQQVAARQQRGQRQLDDVVLALHDAAQSSAAGPQASLQGVCFRIASWFAIGPAFCYKMKP